MPVRQQDLAFLRAPTEQPARQPETAGEGLCGIVDRRGQSVQQRAVGIQYLGDCGLEQLLLASKWL